MSRYRHERLTLFHGLVGGLVIGLSASGPARAQTGATDIGEIVVTASKRETRLQDTALAVNALGADKLDAAAVTDTSALQASVPGLQFARSGDTSFVYLRGIGAGIFGPFAENSVATYVDGVYVPRPAAAVQELFDVERVEVLRGPQATLYGRNATGGAILITSAKPTETFTGSADVRIGNEGARRYRATLSGPIVKDRLSGRFAVVRSKIGGYSTNLVDGSKFDSLDLWALRGSLRWTPTDNLTATLIANYSKQDGSPSTQKSVYPSFQFGPPFNGAYSPDPRTSYHNIRDSKPSQAHGAVLNLNWDMGIGTLTSTTSYQRDEFGPHFIDLDDTNLPLLEYRGQTAQSDFVYQDIYLTSKRGSFEWLLGGTYSHEKSERDHPILTPGGLNHTLSDAKVESYAIYGQLSYELTQKLKMLGALRYSEENRSAGTVILLPGGGSLVAGNDRSWGNLSPKASVEWRPKDDMLIYASATNGFKSGVFNELDVTSAAGPETIWSYEIGARTQWFNRRLTLNATAFHYDYSDLQVFSAVLTGGNVQTVLQNAGEADVDGLEIEASARVTPNFQIGGMLALLDARYAAGTILVDSANSRPPASVAGNRLIQAPEVTLTLYADLNIELGGYGGLRLYADYFRQSERFLTSFEDPTLRSKPYDIVNARVTYTPPGKQFHIAAFVRNAGNTLVLNYAQRIPPFAAANVYGPPRLYGLEVGFRF